MSQPFRRSLAEHREIIEALCGPALRELGSESLTLNEAPGRTLARDLTAPRALPPWDNSQMDGYAVHAQDLGAGPLRVVAPIAAGAPAPALERGTAAPIMTGAPMPVGANTVVPIEAADPHRFPTNAELAGGFTVVLPGSSPVGNYVRAKGSDIAAGSVVMAAGTRLGPTALGLLAGLGINAVEVSVRPAVLLLSTGDELVAPGGELGPGQIHDANTTMLGAALRSAGCTVDTAGVLDDSPAHFADSLTKALAAGGHPYQLVLSSGGISQGAFDVVKEVLAKPRHRVRFGGHATRRAPGRRHAGPARVRSGAVHRAAGQPGQRLCQLRDVPAPGARRIPGPVAPHRNHRQAHRGHGLDAPQGAGAPRHLHGRFLHPVGRGLLAPVGGAGRQQRLHPY